MGIALIFALSVAASAGVDSPARHWEQTAKETIWRGRYKNCDRGYAVDLPTGVVAHDALPPSPNHGVLISASSPATTAEVTLEEPRLIDVYDSNDATELGSPRAYLQFELRHPGKVEIIEARDLKFRHLPAVHVRYQTMAGSSVIETEELIVYRTSGNIGPIFT